MVWLAPTASDAETLIVAAPPDRLAGASLESVAIMFAPGPESVLVASTFVVKALFVSPVAVKMPWVGDPFSAPTPPVAVWTQVKDISTVPETPEEEAKPKLRAVDSTIETGTAIVALLFAVMASARSPDTRKAVTAKMEATTTILRLLDIQLSFSAFHSLPEPNCLLKQYDCVFQNVSKCIGIKPISLYPIDNKWVL